MPPHISDLLRVFGRIGLLSFGGPAAQISLMHRELVEKRPWISNDQFLRGLSFCMLLPGPEAMQLATYIGWRLRGPFGGVLAGVLFILPGACVISTLLWLYVTFGTQPVVNAGFVGIKAAVITIVFRALWTLSKKALHQPLDWIFSAFGFAALFLLNLPFPWIILSAAAVGCAVPQLFATGAPSPVVSPARPHQTKHHLRQVTLWAALWLLPLCALSLWGSPLLAEIGWFFAKLAVVTFGGAYAVLSYMTQTVVQEQAWITSGQMLDSLGLAETTPGPLILVTQFVAMLTGHTAGGAATALAAGAVALWATFMPCFLWIFAAAPFVERLTSVPRLNAALKAITATVVGVILNLSVWFTLSLLFHELREVAAGPVQLNLPDWAALNHTALILVCIAPIAMKACRGNLILLLAGMAGFAILLHHTPILS